MKKTYTWTPPNPVPGLSCPNGASKSLKRLDTSLNVNEYFYTKRPNGFTCIPAPVGTLTEFNAVKALTNSPPLPGGSKQCWVGGWERDENSNTKNDDWYTTGGSNVPLFGLPSPVPAGPTSSPYVYFDNFGSVARMTSSKMEDTFPYTFFGYTTLHCGIYLCCDEVVSGMAASLLWSACFICVCSSKHGSR